MTTEQQEQKIGGDKKADYKQKYEELLQKYNALVAQVEDVGFQIQAFAKQNRIQPNQNQNK
jgi:hypothetical protein